MRFNGRLWLPEAPHLWTRRPRFKTLGLIEPMIRVSGHFLEVALIHPATGKVVESYGPFDNMLLDQGLDLWQNMLTDGVPNFANTLRWCRVGTGNTAPAENQAILDNQIAATNSNGGFATQQGVAAGNEYTWFRVTRVFLQAEANGTLAEVGMGGLNTTELFARQLIQDGLGNPTTITKTSDFQLRVVYEFRVYLPLGDTILPAEIGGTTRDVTARVGLMADWTSQASSTGAVAPSATYNGNGIAATLFQDGGTFGAEGIQPTGTVVHNNAFVAHSYVPGSHKFEAVSHWGAAVANAAQGYYAARAPGNVSAFRPIKFQWTGSPITKTVDDRFVLEHTRRWGRHTP
jgi:hypothetical protein